jgi:signal transduction histidine kinase
MGMQERAALLNTELSIDGSKGPGTTVELTVPARSVYL